MKPNIFISGIFGLTMFLTAINAEASNDSALSKKDRMNDCHIILYPEAISSGKGADFFKVSIS